MALCRTQLRCFVTAVFMHLYAVHCYAQPPPETALGVCDYTLNSLYVVNTILPSTVFPTGYVSCVNATGSDTGLCAICSCRENKVGSEAGVTVVGAVCVGSGDAITCVGPEQQYCDCNNSAGGCTVGTPFLRDGSSNTEAIDDVDVVQDIDSVSPTNGGDTSAENNPTSSPNLPSNFTADSAIDNTVPTIDNLSYSDVRQSLDTNIDTPIPVNAPGSVNLSIDTNSGSRNAGSYSEPGDSTDGGNRSTDSNSADTNASLHASIGTDTDNIPKPASPSIGYGSKVTEPAVENDNGTSDVVGTVKPSQTDAAPPTDQNITPNEHGSTLGTNSGSASTSSWSGEHLTTVLSIICVTGVVAAIAVFVAIRRGQSKEEMELGTPKDDFANDNTSIGTPTSNHGARYYIGGNRSVDSFEHTPLAAIAMIGSDKAFLNSSPSVSKHQYRSYSGAERNASEDTYAPTDGQIVSKDAVVRDSRPSSAAIQQQFLVSNGPSVSVLLSPTSTAMFDTSYSRESFSSDISAHSESPSDELFRESEVCFDSFRVACETSSGIDHDLDRSTNSTNRQTSPEVESEEDLAASSVSSLDSSQYDFRDTTGSENMRESEMNTESSCIAISFDMNSYDTEIL